MILIVDMNHKKGSLGLEEFVLPIASVVKKWEEYAIVHYKELTPQSIASVRKVILSGTPLMDKEFLHHYTNFSWLRETDTPLLGICAGMQFLALLFDSGLKNCLEIGMTEIETTAENPLFSSNFRAYELHTTAVEPSPDFEVLARSDNCVQAIRHKKKEIYGILFHPEVRNREIIERFLQH